MIALYLGILIGWTLVCVTGGQIYERWRQRREDYNQRDAWAARYQDEKGAA